jgi:hypothetical protein
MFSLELSGNRILELGPSLQLCAAFGKMARVAGEAEDADYPQLYYVPQLDQDTPPPDDVLDQIQEQAKLFLHRHAAQLPLDAQHILERLANVDQSAISGEHAP